MESDSHEECCGPAVTAALRAEEQWVCRTPAPGPGHISEGIRAPRLFGNSVFPAALWAAPHVSEWEPSAS